jgi:hypothetical protein
MERSTGQRAPNSKWGILVLFLAVVTISQSELM